MYVLAIALPLTHKLRCNNIKTWPQDFFWLPWQFIFWAHAKVINCGWLKNKIKIYANSKGFYCAIFMPWYFAVTCILCIIWYYYRIGIYAHKICVYKLILLLGITFLTNLFADFGYTHIFEHNFFLTCMFGIHGRWYTYIREGKYYVICL